MDWIEAKYARLTPEGLLRRMRLRRAPVPLVDLAIDLGMTVYTVDHWPDGDAGQIVYDGSENPMIFINGRHSPSRRGLTLAHEIAHAVLHITPGEPGTLPRDKESLTDDPREAEATEYAAELAMPASLIHRFGQRYLWHVPALADRFAVSEAAMVRRVNRLLGHPARRSRY